jgi:acid phosphatase (class A)
MSSGRIPFGVAILLAVLFVPLFQADSGEPAASSVQGQAKLSKEEVSQALMPGRIAGYLSQKSLPNSLALVPPPPGPGSAAFAADEEVSKKSLALRGTPRWALASEDANLQFPQAAGAFSCALNIPITEHETPRLYVLIRRIVADAAAATSAAKDHYQRIRPFVINNQPTCTPADEKALRNNFSYPSGHASIGWALALVLTEIAPDRTDAILARGRSMGQSRVICNAHWPTDVLTGFDVGAATVARLHAEPAFRADVEAVRAELAAVRARGLMPTRDCVAESRALGR